MPKDQDLDKGGGDAGMSYKPHVVIAQSTNNQKRNEIMKIDHVTRKISRRKAVQYTSLLMVSGGVEKVIASPGSALRQIVLDTEITGISVANGDRIIEIGCVELINHQRTGHDLHFYFNPERDSHEDALRVHGISNEFLRGKPKFGEVADEILAYLKDAEIIIHNASFDLGFLDKELEILGKPAFNTYVASVVDTLKLAKERFPGKRNSLHALCDRLNVDCSGRTLHGALLDAELLADVYVRLLKPRGNLSVYADVPA